MSSKPWGVEGEKERERRREGGMRGGEGEEGWTRDDVGEGVEVGALLTVNSTK